MKTIHQVARQAAEQAEKRWAQEPRGGSLASLSSQISDSVAQAVLLEVQKLTCQYASAAGVGLQVDRALAAFTPAEPPRSGVDTRHYDYDTCQTCGVMMPCMAHPVTPAETPQQEKECGDSWTEVGEQSRYCTRPLGHSGPHTDNGDLMWKDTPPEFAVAPAEPPPQECAMCHGRKLVRSSHVGMAMSSPAHDWEACSACVTPAEPQTPEPRGLWECKGFKAFPLSDQRYYADICASCGDIHPKPAAPVSSEIRLAQQAVRRFEQLEQDESAVSSFARPDRQTVEQAKANLMYRIRRSSVIAQDVEALIIAATAHGRAQTEAKWLAINDGLHAYIAELRVKVAQYRETANLATRLHDQLTAAEAQLAEQDAEIQRLRALMEPHG